MKNQAKLYTTIGIIAVIVVCLIGNFYLEDEKEENIKIGMITILTGDLAYYGNGILNAAELATAEINNNGGIDGKKIQLIVEDSSSDAKTAVTVANKLINIDNVDVLLGPITSGEVLAVAPVANNNGVVLISTAATSPEITNAGDYIFRDVASDDLRIKKYADYIFNEKNIREIAIIYGNHDFGVAFKEGFVNAYEALGGTVLIVESHEKDATDVRTQLAKIKNKNPEAILMMSYASATGSILKQSKELGIKTQFFGIEEMADPVVAEIAGDAVNGVIYIQAAALESKEKENFIKKYKEKYGEEPPFYAAEAYDAIKLYEVAMKDGINSEKIKNNLYKIKDFEGASGTITFDQNGDCRKPFEIGQVQNRELITLKII